jgi:hypothetical protein
MDGSCVATTGFKGGAAPHPPFGHLLPVNGAKELLAALHALVLQRWRLAKSPTKASFSPFYGEKMAAAR